jgi:hypothetical protein
MADLELRVTEEQEMADLEHRLQVSYRGARDG